MISFTLMIASLTAATAIAGSQTATSAANGLPPIDLAAPSEFETISFGLG
jgi:hypothetical protein